MDHLISGIQHFFAVTFLAVITTVTVALPFNKPATYPTPSPKQEVQVEKESTPSASPSEQPAKQSVTQPSNTLGTSMTPSPSISNLIDCSGPDGKIIRLTQKQCDDFNSAWNRPRITPSSNSQAASSPSNNSASPNTGSTLGTYNYPNTYYPSTNQINSSNNSSSNPQPSSTPINTPLPVDNSIYLQGCLSNAQSNYDSQMDDLNRRGMSSSGQADQVKSSYTAQQQSCHQQWGS